MMAARLQLLIPVSIFNTSPTTDMLSPVIEARKRTGPFDCIGDEV
jgi:hypothetical protein